MLLSNFVTMKQEVKLLLVAGIGYLGFKAYQVYTAIKRLTFAPTGINFSIIKDRGAIGGTLFVDILNPTAANVAIDGFTGTVTTTSGTVIGDFKSGAMTFRPGANKVRISWGSRNSLTLVNLAIGIAQGKFPVINFNMVFNIKSIPIPVSFKVKTADYKPTFI